MMLRPRCPSAGPIGGEGFAAPAGTCNFRYPVTFFAMYRSCCAGRSRLFQGPWSGWRGVGGRPLPPAASIDAKTELRAFRSDLLDLTEFQFDGRGAAEDRHRDLYARARLVNFFNHTGERRERAIGHADVLADFQRHRRLRTFDAFMPLMHEPHTL